MGLASFNQLRRAAAERKERERREEDTRRAAILSRADRVRADGEAVAAAVPKPPEPKVFTWSGVWHTDRLRIAEILGLPEPHRKRADAEAALAAAGYEMKEPSE